ncbi:MAG: phosphoribosylanthranilate isomerase [Prevotella sp.]|nr:phosphoribosylanthranilate isomerase [Prevotella sp.]
MKIKVCGMRDAQNIRDVAALDIDLMGFIFYPKSPRFVSLISSQAGIIPDYSPERLNMAVNADGKPGYIFPKRIKRVGVFVDEMPQTIITYVYNYSLDYIQLHGKETPTLIDNLRRTLVPDLVPDIKVIKAFGITSADDLQQCEAYEGYADLFLFDTRTPLKGGSGRQFNWSVLESYHGRTPFLLSGGIGPEDADRVKAFHHPQCVGIDLNSRFETAPAMKDVELLSKFIKQIKDE